MVAPRRKKVEPEPASSVAFDRVMRTYIRLEHHRAALRMLLRVIEPFLVDDDGEVQRVWTDRNCIRPEVSADAFLEVWGQLRQLEEEVTEKLNGLASVRVDAPSLEEE